jgi:hypothetical protein
MHAQLSPSREVTDQFSLVSSEAKLQVLLDRRRQDCQGLWQRPSLSR